MAEPDHPTARRSGRWVYVLGILGFLAYAAWMMGPYLRSIIIRDATVTTWLNWATAPIEGTITWSIGDEQIVGSDGVIARIENAHITRHTVEEHQFRVKLAQARVQELQAFLEEIQGLDRQRADLKAKYADTFRAQLDVEIASLAHKITVYQDRLRLTREITARMATLANKRHATQIVADESAIRTSNLEVDLADLQERLGQARVRRDAANKGVFIDANGEDPSWGRGMRMELKLEKKRARLELREAQAKLSEARMDAEASQKDFERLKEATIRVPPGSIVWTKPLTTGATVVGGQAVAGWLDCSNLMIDVPVGDAEVALIKPGMEADVVLEGESETHKAHVLLTRGSAATLGKADLAAVAKGRHEGVAQVLLDFSSEHDSFAECPVGRAAYVDFRGIGLIDVIRARLRL